MMLDSCNSLLFVHIRGFFNSQLSTLNLISISLSADSAPKNVQCGAAADAEEGVAFPEVEEGGEGGGD